jgi:hypothetical protein
VRSSVRRNLRKGSGSHPPAREQASLYGNSRQVPEFHPSASIFTDVSEGPGTIETAADVVIRVAPTDDVGARTADLFDWQAAMAAVDGLSLYHRSLDDDGQIPDTDDSKIICEHHEDWVVVSGPNAELVSAKHRELSTGPFMTTVQLVEAGGLGHLFNRWWSLLSKPRCRLVTSTAPASGEVSRLAQATELLRERAAGAPLSADQTTMIDRVIETFARAVLSSKHCPSAWLEPVDPWQHSHDQVPDHQLAAEAFLKSLTIDHSRPGRQLIQDISPTRYARPVLARMSGPDGREVEAAVWEAVHNLFRARMRDAGPSPTGGLSTALSGPWASGASSVPNWLATRTVTNADIHVAIQTARKNPLGYRPLRAPSKLTKLSVKMARGECADTSIGRAEELRMAYSRYWRERRNNVPGSSSEKRALERVLLRLADRATRDCRLPTEAWGTPFWSALDQGTESMKTNLPKGFESDLALGGISDLAAQCKVWFSDAFDVKAAINEMKKERGL